MRYFFPFTLLLFSGCLGMPKGVSPVRDFSVKRYLGTWYEIARLDHPFERGLTNVTATYSLRRDGGVRVVNRGWSSKQNRWKKAVGRAYFVDTKTRGHFKVTFFWPFYGSYVIFDLDPNYSIAYVSGDTTRYLWLLSRTPTLSAEAVS